MDMKVSYLDSAPDLGDWRHPKKHLQTIIDEFAKVDKPAMRIDLGDHYSNARIGRTTLAAAIKKSGYSFRVHLDTKENCVYIIKRNLTEEG